MVQKSTLLTHLLGWWCFGEEIGSSWLLPPDLRFYDWWGRYDLLLNGFPPSFEEGRLEHSFSLQYQVERRNQRQESSEVHQSCRAGFFEAWFHCQDGLRRRNSKLHGSSQWVESWRAECWGPIQLDWYYVATLYRWLGALSVVAYTRTIICRLLCYHGPCSLDVLELSRVRKTLAWLYMTLRT